MKREFYLILNICFSVFAFLNETEIKRGISYNIVENPFPYSLEENFKQKTENEPDLKLSEEAPLSDSNIIELESDYIINQISWTKKDNYKFNYLFGVFEGSNDKSFSDPIPIAIIKDYDNLKKINYLDVNSKISYKYIRYIPPNNNNTDISPIKIFVSKQISKQTSENLNESNYFQVTKLPLVSINTENSTEPNQNDDINCTITIINNGRIENRDSAFIKVRGRSTSFTIKKPYRIKFSTKQKILSFKGKEKKWTLLANYYDRSLLRNVVAFKISELMQFQFTPRCQPVDVILNGNFRGNYYICDKLDVISKNRLNLTEMEKTDISEPNITGGYLLEIDARSGRSRSNSTFKTEKGITGQIVIPDEDEITPEQSLYIKERLNIFEDEIYNGILDSIDIDSYSKYFLVEEFCGDPDHAFSSFYFTKERNDDKFHFGPVWDFDLAFDNDKRLIPTSNKTEFCFNYCDSAGTTRDFLKALIGNKEIIRYIKNTWDLLCNTVLNENTLIDFLEEEKLNIKESAEMNFLKWDNFVEKNEGGGRHWHMELGRKGENFDDSVEVVKDYIRNRFESLKNLINNALSLAN